MSNHCVDCDYCGKDTRGLSGVTGCDTLKQVEKCYNYQNLNKKSVDKN